MIWDVILCLSLLSVGLFAGVMLALVVILQKQWDRLEGERYVDTFQGFLLVAKGNPVMSVITFTSFLLPLGSGIVHLWNGFLLPGLLLLSAGLVFFAGCLLVTLKMNFPIYDEVIGWGNRAGVKDWRRVRKRFYRLNIVRMTCALAAFGFLAGVVLH